MISVTAALVLYAILLVLALSAAWLLRTLIHIVPKIWRAGREAWYEYRYGDEAILYDDQNDAATWLQEIRDEAVHNDQADAGRPDDRNVGR